MSVLLNKNRVIYTKILAVLAGMCVLLTQYNFAFMSPTLHLLSDLFGYFLVALCALGRLYCSAFLGGFKNQKIIDYGPFSVCRNPLYAFSLLGITGISIISAHITVMLILPVVLLIVYHFLIKREEVFLLDRFGQDYLDYKNRVPRLLPNFSLYAVPERIEVNPKLLRKAFFDALAWFLAFPIIELIEMLHNQGYIPVLFVLP